MTYLKTISLSLLLLVMGWVSGTIVGFGQFPQKELKRVTAATVDASGGWWQFSHRTEVVTPEFKTVVRPAIDFLYSSAGISAQQGPHVLSIPPIDRYFVFQFMEEDTDVYAYIGSRTHGLNTPLEVLLVPKGYKGETHSLEVIEMTAPTSWVLARFRLFDERDVPNIEAIQQEVRFIPIEEYVGK